ncbi:hypothetical protein ZWY2020_037724 [Hordeum vulgare]|nr:hypothetical protein ZWY2020_037724 [Hordeum vulgare]
MYSRFVLMLASMAHDEHHGVHGTRFTPALVYTTVTSNVFSLVLVHPPGRIWRYLSISAADDGNQGFVVVSTRSFRTQDVCSRSTALTPRPNPAGAAVPLVHRHGPCAKSQSTDKPSSFADALHEAASALNTS